MSHEPLIFTIFLIFAGAAVLSTIALVTRQSMLVAYMVLGVLLGPWVLGWVGDTELIHSVSNVGIMFLLFLLGLHLPPGKLMSMLKQVSLVGVVSSLVFGLIGYLVGVVIGLTPLECLVVGAAMMFSSTIIGIKLLPTTILHHQHTGEVMIGVLLFQDILAIAVLLLMHGAATQGVFWNDVKLLLIGLPLTLVFAMVFERYVLNKLFMHFNKVKEYTFLLAIGWCLGMAELANYFNLSGEIGAFVAGVTLASSPISLYIAESLKPVRDFFLIMFFFSVGANFDLNFLGVVIIPAIVLAVVLLVVKPTAYRYLLGRIGEDRKTAWEVGFRLGQISEFSLIIAYVGLDQRLIGSTAAYLIQATTILTFIASTYFVVRTYPTPVAMCDQLRRD